MSDIFFINLTGQTVEAKVKVVMLLQRAHVAESG